MYINRNGPSTSFLFSLVLHIITSDKKIAKKLFQVFTNENDLHFDIVPPYHIHHLHLHIYFVLKVMSDISIAHFILLVFISHLHVCVGIEAVCRPLSLFGSAPIHHYQSNCLFHSILSIFNFIF